MKCERLLANKKNVVNLLSAEFSQESGKGCGSHFLTHFIGLSMQVCTLLSCYKLESQLVHITFGEIDHEFIFTVIHPFAESKRGFVSY